MTRPLKTLLSMAFFLSALAPAFADEFTSYCAPLAGGEVLESELNPENMAYIFDQNGQVIRSRADELTEYYETGISDACDANGVAAHVLQYEARVMLEIYPPGQLPLGISPETMRGIRAGYEACVHQNLLAVDTNGNGVIDPNEDRAFYDFMEQPCNQELQRDLQHEGRMAVLSARQAEAEARTAEAEARIADAEARIAAANARMQALTDSLIAAAREDVGL